MNKAYDIAESIKTQFNINKAYWTKDGISFAHEAERCAVYCYNLENTPKLKRKDAIKSNQEYEQTRDKLREIIDEIILRTDDKSMRSDVLGYLIDHSQTEMKNLISGGILSYKDKPTFESAFRKYASETDKENNTSVEDIVAHMKKDSRILAFLSDDVRNNKEIIKEVVEQCLENNIEISYSGLRKGTLSQNPDAMLELIAIHSNALEGVNPTLWEDNNFAKKAYQVAQQSKLTGSYHVDLIWNGEEYGSYGPSSIEELIPEDVLSKIKQNTEMRSIKTKYPDYEEQFADKSGDQKGIDIID